MRVRTESHAEWEIVAGNTYLAMKTLKIIRRQILEIMPCTYLGNTIFIISYNMVKFIRA